MIDRSGFAGKWGFAQGMEKDHPKSEHPVHVDLFGDCPKCGFPARAGDRRCLYCGSSLILLGKRSNTGLSQWGRIVRQVLSHLFPLREVLRTAYLLVIGACLTGAGIAISIGLLGRLGGFTRLLAALFLLGYGIQALWASLPSRRKRLGG